MDSYDLLVHGKHAPKKSKASKNLARARTCNNQTCSYRNRGLDSDDDEVDTRHHETRSYSEDSEDDASTMTMSVGIAKERKVEENRNYEHNQRKPFKLSKVPNWLEAVRDEESSDDNPTIWRNEKRSPAVPRKYPKPKEQYQPPPKNRDKKCRNLITICQEDYESDASDEYEEDSSDPSPDQRTRTRQRDCDKCKRKHYADFITVRRIVYAPHRGNDRQRRKDSDRDYQDQRSERQPKKYLPQREYDETYAPNSQDDFVDPKKQPINQKQEKPPPAINSFERRDEKEKKPKNFKFHNMEPTEQWSICECGQSSESVFDEAGSQATPNYQDVDSSNNASTQYNEFNDAETPRQDSKLAKNTKGRQMTEKSSPSSKKQLKSDFNLIICLLQVHKLRTQLQKSFEILTQKYHKQMEQLFPRVPEDQCMCHMFPQLPGETESLCQYCKTKDR